MAIVGLTLMAVAWGMLAGDGGPLNGVLMFVVNGATVRTHASPGSTPPGIEGFLLFVRLVDRGGSTMLDARFDWPDGARVIPAGTFDASAYFRSCNGNCMELGTGEWEICAIDRVTLASGDTLQFDLGTWSSMAVGGGPCRPSVE